jgi:hypothetical protein
VLAVAVKSDCTRCQLCNLSWEVTRDGWEKPAATIAAPKATPVSIDAMMNLGASTTCAGCFQGQRRLKRNDHGESGVLG